MPINIRELDSSSRDDTITIILGRNIILKIIEKPASDSLLKNNLVKKLVSVKNLCNEEISLQITDLIKKESELYDLAMIPASITWTKADTETFFESETELTEMDELEKIIASLQMRIENIVSAYSPIMAFWEVSEKKLLEKDKELVSVNENLKEKIGFNFLIPSNLLLCPDCKIVLSKGELEISKKCSKCEKEINREQAKRIYIHKIPDEIKKFWNSNLWFEAYVAGLLRKLQWQTWTNVYVMGSSGILHEIDFLAIKSGSILIGECKTGKVSRNDVFNFCTKANDIKAHLSILALMKELPDPETRDFVIRNPSIIRLENMCKLEEADILVDLENRLSIKG